MVHCNAENLATCLGGSPQGCRKDKDSIVSNLSGSPKQPHWIIAVVWFISFCVALLSASETPKKPAEAPTARSALTLSYQYEGRVWLDQEINALRGTEATEAAVEAVRSCRLTTNNSPWVIMHGLLAFGDGLVLYDPESKQLVNAVPFLCDDKLKTEKFGYRLFQKRPDGLRVLRGAKFVLQDHADQLLMIFGRMGLSLDTPILLENGEQSSVKAALNYSLREVHTLGELAFTLPAYCKYLPPKKRWKNKYGTPMVIGKLAAKLADRPIDRGPCFGTHRLYALAICLHRPENLESADDENWIKLRKAIGEAIKKARTHQNPDGSFNIPWWGKGRACMDDDEVIHMYGHMLSWLAIACQEEDAPWIDKSAVSLARAVLRVVPKEKVPYSWLAHAVEGLKLHLQKRNAKNTKTKDEKSSSDINADLVARIGRKYVEHP